MDETDKIIDGILKENCVNGRINTQSIENAKRTYLKLMCLPSYNILNPSIGNEMFLTGFGKKVKKIGWLKHLGNEEKLEKRRELKESLDFSISKFQAKTKLLPYFVAGISLIISIIALFYKPEQIQQTPIQKSEIITIIDSVLTSNHYQGDSLLNNP